MAAWWQIVDLGFVFSSAGIIQVAQMVLCLMAFVCVQASEWCRKIKDSVCEPVPGTHMLTVFLCINMAVVIVTVVGYAVFTFGIHKKIHKNWNMINAVLGCLIMIALLVAICFLASNISVYITGVPGITAGLCIDFVAFINAAGYVFFNVMEIRKRKAAAEPGHGETVGDGGQSVFTGGLSTGEGEDFLRPEGEPTLSSMRPLSSSSNMKDCYEVDLTGGRVSNLSGASAVSSTGRRGSECSSDSSRSFKNAVELVITEATPVHS